MTSYKVMMSNDSHTWITLTNGSEDLVSNLNLTSGVELCASSRNRKQVGEHLLQSTCRGKTQISVYLPSLMSREATVNIHDPRADGNLILESSSELRLSFSAVAVEHTSVIDF